MSRGETKRWARGGKGGSSREQHGGPGGAVVCNPWALGRIGVRINDSVVDGAGALNGMPLFYNVTLMQQFKPEVEVVHGSIT